MKYQIRIEHDNRRLISDLLWAGLIVGAFAVLGYWMGQLV